ncbi:hypothetical protein M407DRAFT_203672 [Tulasnella calospora MUT 4182]|uniref:DUF6533 domain-containing protein n=1 Tax=Tulasnella calospora MUT 4182 TaxID=1051891 RepID=A0A0C3LXG3_9AGAM|nr:hypothetical protein M407DRAFT_203672 [Tulasnella calospora MUT 4182]
MIEHTHREPVSPRQIVLHAEASRYMTLVGFTILLWDHICTIDEEIRFIWTASRSLVKILFLVVWVVGGSDWFFGSYLISDMGPVSAISGACPLG